MKEQPIYKKDLEKVFRYWEDSNILERRWKIINSSIANYSKSWKESGSGKNNTISALDTSK